MKEWIGNLNQNNLPAETTSWLDKYNSPEEALVGGFNAQKMAGVPFKLPESLDKLPDDTMRNNFTSQVNKLMGAVQKEEELADVDFSEGLADARNQNQDLVTELKKFAVGKPKSFVVDLVKFINGFNNNMITGNENRAIEKAKEVRQTLSVLYGGEEKVNENYESVRRLFQNEMGLSAEEYNNAGKSFIDNVLAKDAVMSKGMMNLAKNIVKEGSTPPGEPPVNKETGSVFTSKDSPTGKALGW